MVKIVRKTRAPLKSRTTTQAIPIFTPAEQAKLRKARATAKRAATHDKAKKAAADAEQYRPKSLPLMYSDETKKFVEEEIVKSLNNLIDPPAPREAYTFHVTTPGSVQFLGGGGKAAGTYAPGTPENPLRTGCGQTAEPSRAGSVLHKAAEIVDGARQQTHGEKERSFQTIATLWNTYLFGRKGVIRAIETDGSIWFDFPIIDPHNVAQMMELMKIARSISGTAVEDHYVDSAGYAALAAELALQKE